MSDWRTLNVTILENISQSTRTLAGKSTAVGGDMYYLATTLDSTATYLVSGMPDHPGPTGTMDEWIGPASDAFISAWSERKQTLQDLSTTFDRSSNTFLALAKSIDDNVQPIKDAQAFEVTQQQNPSSVSGMPQQYMQQIFDNAQQAANNMSLALSLASSELNNRMNLSVDCEGMHAGVSPNTIPTQTNPYLYMTMGKGLPPMPSSMSSYMDQATWESLLTDLVNDSNPNFPLTQEDAALALSDAPPGTVIIEVAGSGGGGADILFKDSNGQVIGRREVKCISGTWGAPRPFAAGSFSDEISKAAKQANYNGDIFVQVPNGTDYQYYLQNFVNVRKQAGANIAKYQQVTITIVDQSGNVLYSGPLFP